MCRETLLALVCNIQIVKSSTAMLGILFRASDSVCLICSEAYSEPCQTCKMEHFAKIVNGCKQNALSSMFDRVLNTSLMFANIYYWKSTRLIWFVDGQICDLLPISSWIFAEIVFSSSLDGIYIPFDQFLRILLSNGIDNRAIKILE